MSKESGADWRQSDSYAEREARNYDNPVPSREFISDYLREQGRPVQREELEEAFELKDEESCEGLRRRLIAMTRDGQIILNRREGYLVVDRKDLIAGNVVAHPDGFGFLKPDEGGDDLFLAPKQMRALMHRDHIVARVAGTDQRGRREGVVVEILERRTHKIVGRFHREHGIGFVFPDNRRITHDVTIIDGECGGAQEGQIVAVEIVEQPTQRTGPIGRVSEVLGFHMQAGLEIDIAIASHGINVDWPEAVEKKVAEMSDQVAEADKAGREDLRHLPLVTIDGEDSKDFDDAVYCKSTLMGWKLIVAIADVSHYVLPNSPLDEEAQERGNSVYFPGRVVPMLPEILSNGLCSLNPDVDRLCLACEMTISRTGKVTRTRFLDGVMRSHARLTYNQVGALLEGRKQGLPQKVLDREADLKTLHKLYKVLARNRRKRGAIEFEAPESYIVFGEGQKIDRIEQRVRNDAHKLIEECMLAANVSAARYLEKRKMPFLYRNHSGPNPDKLENVRSFLAEVGIKFAGGDDPKPKHYAEVLQKAKGRPDERLIQTVMLRSMMQAQYSPIAENGHFGLAYDSYAHFTSPIRRYPDLLVHRALRHALRGGKPGSFDMSVERLIPIGQACSASERRADEATRDATDWLKCEYMLDQVGEEFDGTISSVTGFGIFVELNEEFVEGLVHITNLPRDFFEFDNIHHRLVGSNTGLTYNLADQVRVKVAAVNLDDRKIDFELIETRPYKEAPPKRDGRGGRDGRDRGRGGRDRGRGGRDRDRGGKGGRDRDNRSRNSRGGRNRRDR